MKFQGTPEVPELFFNDRRMTLARWPDKDWTTIASIVAPGSVPRNGDKSDVGGVFEYSGDRPRALRRHAGEPVAAPLADVDFLLSGAI